MENRTTTRIDGPHGAVGTPMDIDTPLDPGIKRYVEVLREAGIETFESCEGGEGHTYPEPTIRFHGERSEGFRALAVASQHAFPVRAIRRIWSVIDGEPVGPDWEIAFWRTCEKDAPPDTLAPGKCQVAAEVTPGCQVEGPAGDGMEERARSATIAALSKPWQDVDMLVERLTQAFVAFARAELAREVTARTGTLGPVVKATGEGRAG